MTTSTQHSKHLYLLDEQPLLVNKLRIFVVGVEDLQVGDQLHLVLAEDGLDLGGLRRVRHEDLEHMERSVWSGCSGGGLHVAH